MPSPPVTASTAPAQAEHAELLQVRGELAARKSEIAQLKGELAAARAESEQRRQQNEAQARDLAALRERISELENKAAHGAALRSRVAELEEATARMQELEFRAEELAEKLAERDSLVGVLQNQLVTLPPASAAVNDDLKNIRGIGPKYEKGLRSLGITTYRQIADWTTADIAIFAEKLKVKPERIVRDDWVGRARKLLGG
ncbi:MAG TPA: hypothetical protein VM686_31455 [Polyangiaceae bacterium]|nr:hypothetical protein [Polyangiaceae bacterium]